MMIWLASVSLSGVVHSNLPAASDTAVCQTSARVPRSSSLAQAAAAHWRACRAQADRLANSDCANDILNIDGESLTTIIMPSHNESPR